MDIQKNIPLAPYTTVKIGGPAQFFIHVQNTSEFLEAINYGKDYNLPITILGNGSNVLISDSGIRGLVIKNDSNSFDILDTQVESKKLDKISTHRTEENPTKYLNFGALDYDESDKPKVLVKIDSGCLLSQIINQLIDQGITGLQWFGYIPGTIGGAVYSNIHGGAYHFSDFIESVEVFDLQNKSIKNLKKAEIIWDYDSSSFQQNSNLIIISANLSLYKGDTIKAKETVAAWIKQKSYVQLMNSIGSVFKNPPLEVCIPIWGEQKSTGWIIDNELHLKEYSIGDAQVSPLHANFIINNGHATASNYLKLIKYIQSKALEKLNLTLEPEIKFLGEF